MEATEFKEAYSNNLKKADELRKKLQNNSERGVRLKKKYAKSVFKEFRFGEKVLVKFLGRNDYVEGYIGDMNTIICYSPEKYGEISSFYVRVEIYDKNPRGKGYTDLLGTVIFDHIQQGAADIKHFNK